MSNIAPAAHRIAGCGCNKSATATAVGKLVARVSDACSRTDPDPAKVGAFVDRPTTSGERAADLVWGAAEGGLAWTLFTGSVPFVGTKVFASAHPVWGAIVGLFAVSNIASAARGKTYDWQDDPKP